MLFANIGLNAVEEGEEEVQETLWSGEQCEHRQQGERAIPSRAGVFTQRPGDLLHCTRGTQTRNLAGIQKQSSGVSWVGL